MRRLHRLALALLLVLPIPALAAEASAASMEDLAARLDELGAEAWSETPASEPGSPTQDAIRSLKHLERQLLRDQKQAGVEPLVYCVPTTTSLCLLGRFTVRASFINPFEGSGEAQVAGAQQLTPESGYMYFLSRTNMEIPIKMVPFCFETPGSFGVFVAGLTNFGVLVRVTDNVTGQFRDYFNPSGNVFNTILRKETLWPC